MATRAHRESIQAPDITSVRRRCAIFCEMHSQKIGKVLSDETARRQIWLDATAILPHLPTRYPKPTFAHRGTSSISIHPGTEKDQRPPPRHHRSSIILFVSRSILRFAYFSRTYRRLRSLTLGYPKLVLPPLEHKSIAGICRSLSSFFGCTTDELPTRCAFRPD